MNMYGTLTTLKAEAKVAVQSQHSDNVIHSRTIKVVEECPAPVPQQTRVVNSEIIDNRFVWLNIELSFN